MTKSTACRYLAVTMPVLAFAWSGPAAAAANHSSNAGPQPPVDMIEVEPRQRGAKEYPAELYFDSKRLDKAVQRPEIADRICPLGCRQYPTLARAIDSHRDSASASSSRG
ncbi:MAG: hypothetical protein QNJ85_01045 [Gammaproteobacteria bacterium]|nr:hypothetical protein [Gammaproteobacteria bacterium]